MELLTLRARPKATVPAPFKRGKSPFLQTILLKDLAAKSDPLLEKVSGRWKTTGVGTRLPATHGLMAFGASAINILGIEELSGPIARISLDSAL